MDGRRQDEVICLRRLLNRQIAKPKRNYRGLIEKYNQIPISLFWTITVYSGINLIPVLYISFFQPHFQRSESLDQCVLEQQLCYLRTWMLLCFTELSNRQCFKESQGKIQGVWDHYLLFVWEIHTEGLKPGRVNTRKRSPFPGPRAELVCSAIHWDSVGETRI